ncbi:metallophosphoesterase family protein [Pampinifervens florentissimum]|uniref:metallophosphoesterase family protein n=1 Tax=Pampinifervens florentissimum TaxID=1632019 RepID=UPI0013B49823|nr:exonuclease subunit SbcD [Hydrogenobacter sp. T-8]QID33585.1 exonuclease subunit SbcD [Hydrogenobacter sp. T-8]
MRILHIADLHAGKRLYDRIGRNEDLLYALEQIKNICKEERVDILLIAGDVFDKRNPDFESQGLIMEFLTEMNALGLHILLIAGNHDSYDFMKIYKNLRKLANIHVFDRPSANLKESIFQYEQLKVACLPYPDERVLTHFDEERQRSYAEKVANYMRALAHEVEDSRYRVLVAHMMVDRAQIAGSELQSSVSPYYAIKAETIPDTFQYVALGHVHRNQRIEGIAPKVYYSGSPYQIDFSEKGMDKFVNLVVLEDGMAKVEPIRLDLKRQLVEIRLKEGEDIQKSLEPLAKENLLVRVVMEVKMSDPFFQQKRDAVFRILGDRLARLEIEPVGTFQETKAETGKMDLLSLYEDFHRFKYRSEPSEDLKALLQKLIDKVSHETHKA